MKKKNVVLIVICILLLVCFYFGYKGFNLYYYNIKNITTENYQNFIDSLYIKETINIKHNELSQNDYLEFKAMKIKNEFQEFKKLEYPQSTEDSLKLVLDKKDSKNKIAFWMSETDTYVELLKTDKTLFGTGDNRITNGNLTDVLKKNNITNDIELFQFLEKQKSVKNNIFTSIKQMKENYALQFMVSVCLPTIENITLIDGDYQGYIFNMKNMKEVSILKNNKRYVFMFMDTTYFTDEKIKDLLSTLVIE